MVLAENQQDWIPLLPIDQIPSGLSCWTKKRKRIVIVKNSGKSISVFEDKCPHNNRIKISKSFDLEPNQITCKYHGACYKLDSGIQVSGPGCDNLTVFPHRVVENILEVIFD